MFEISIEPSKWSWSRAIPFGDHCPISFTFIGKQKNPHWPSLETRSRSGFRYQKSRNRLNNRLSRKDEEPVKLGDFEAKLDPVLTKMEQDLAKIKEENPENWFEDVYRMYKDRTNWFNYTDTYSNLIINGLVLWTVQSVNYHGSPDGPGQNNFFCKPFNKQFRAYAIYYRRWMENFDRSQLLVVDGTDMLTNPSKWITMAQVWLLPFIAYIHSIV